MSTTATTNKLSIVLPAKNEAAPLETLLPRIKALHATAEIIVVDDGSTDATAAIAEHHGVKIVSHATSLGNGAAIKSGARAATRDILVFMDADGQHDPAEIVMLTEQLERGFDMAVGARKQDAHASIGRRIANGFYNLLAGFMTGHKVEDLTSGFRAVKATEFKTFLYMLPNGFSYPTTITMAFFRAGYQIAYVPITVSSRIGKSHINIAKDGVRFLLIILKVGTLYSPLKLFAPLSAISFLSGIAHYLYSFITSGRFTNMSALLFSLAVLIFLIGLVSEQITTLLYKDSEK